MNVRIARKEVDPVPKFIFAIVSLLIDGLGVWWLANVMLYLPLTYLQALAIVFVFKALVRDVLVQARI